MRIFLSSTAFDLYDIRAYVVNELKKAGHEVIHHENATFPVHFGHSHDECLEAVKKCDVVLCILDRRYGGTYSGSGASYIEPQQLSINYKDEKGNKREDKVVIGKDKLSITWCELLAAFEHKKPVMTFARKRMLDEKHTRRANQKNKKFRTSYVDNELLFDLTDWITKQKRCNWIAEFNNILDLGDMLARWIGALNSEFVVNTSKEGEPEPPESHVAVLVEGEFDRIFVRYIIQKLNLRSFYAISTGGGHTLVSQVNSLLEESENSPYDRTVVLADADLRELFRPLSPRLAKTSATQLFLADPSIESWIAAGIDPDYYKEKNGAINKKDFEARFGRINSATLQQHLAKYDVNMALKLVPELSNFVNALSASDTTKNNHRNKTK